ncbi:sodium:dicarboxylate cotransporter (permease SLC13 domain) [Arcobacter venerupis]|uniref:Sodium:dicarboxylate cotransporter (Permease SLC13 domain) n=1 Tax=Arcobacter venerupis TaxID=1054033 RepID=A0AAE7B8B3_9BACT|nr:DASS family sodium-coupled anion symporter [Arcobacter venerupis]QKF66961.1 sodium:dicarboxylate cotransporter (permease SLC13 domain) [Arcobacter venerupis]RWS50090.1 anion transporter [Arcobacter venerupis]
MKNIFISIIASALFFFVATNFFNTQHSILIALIALLVILWTNEALPIGVVSLLPIVLFPAFGVLDIKDTTVNYSNTTIFLFMGGFMIAIATQKTNLHKYISNKLLTIFPSTPRGMIFSLAFTSALLSSVLSNSTTALLLIPIAIFLTENMKFKARLALSIAYGCSIGGIITPIGTPPNLILLGFMQQHSLEPIAFIQWIFLTGPLALVMLIIIPFLLSIGLSDVKLDNKVKLTEKLLPNQKRLLFILLGLIITLLVNSKIEPYYSGLGLNETAILLSFGLLMFVPKVGFLDWEDSRNIPYEIIFLFGAGFTIAAAFSKTGLAAVVANYMLALTDFPTIALILMIAALITFTTEVTSNTALISIALPIIYSLGQVAKIDMTLILMVATICASYAFMLPIATPPNAIAMSSGAVKVREMAKFGFIINIFAILIVTITALVYWQYFI